MLLSLAQWLQTLSPEFGFFRVFQYLTFRAVMGATFPALPERPSWNENSSHGARVCSISPASKLASALGAQASSSRAKGASSQDLPNARGLVLWVIGPKLFFMASVIVRL